jgi:hypothetical protein
MIWVKKKLLLQSIINLTKLHYRSGKKINFIAKRKMYLQVLLMF